MQVLRVSWRVLKALRTFLLVSFLLLSVALNVSIFFGGMLLSMASGAVEAVTGVKSVITRQTAEIADLSKDIDAERRVSRELRNEAAGLSDNLLIEKNVSRKLKGDVVELSDDLNTERRLTQKLKGDVVGLSDNLVKEKQLTRKLSGDVNRLTANLATLQGQVDDIGQRQVSYKGKRVALSTAAASTSDIISRRASVSASRNVASMFGEALPWFGTAVIVTVTTIEVKELCETIKDINALKRAIDPELEPGEEQMTVCSMEVPTKEEVWEMAKSSPGLAWEKAKAVTPTLDEIKEIDLSEYGELLSASFLTSTSWTVDKVTGVGKWLEETARKTREAATDGIDRILGSEEPAVEPAK